MKNGLAVALVLLVLLLGAPGDSARPVDAPKRVLYPPRSGDSSVSRSAKSNPCAGTSSTGRGLRNLSKPKSTKQQEQIEIQDHSINTVGAFIHAGDVILSERLQHAVVTAGTPYGMGSQHTFSSSSWSDESSSSSHRRVAGDNDSSNKHSQLSRSGPGNLHTDLASTTRSRVSSSNGILQATSRRHLQQSVLCPAGCAPGFCVRASNDPVSGFKCQQCLNNLVVDKASGACACPSGRYSNAANSCADCPKGAYCDGGVYARGSPNQPALLTCPGNMTTLGLRSSSIRACVNLPGFYYTINAATSEVGAVVCPADTYGPGFRKQRGCVPCPTNYKTNGLTGRTTPLQCFVPAGYFLKMPGVLAPCPMGEWKDGTGPAGNCTKCAFGVTTPADASTSPAACTVLLPGYYAVTIAPSGAITAAAACPQKYWCPGAVPGQVFDPLNPAGLSPSEPSIQLCPDGTWTQERGAVSIDQCLTPPGFYTSGSVTQQCSNGSYRADWLPSQQASSCLACGSGVQGDKSDRITVYTLTGGSTLLPVMTTSSDCFIQAGQGLMYSSLSQTFRARNCEDNTYGVPSRFYGLTPYPCRPCPTGLIASNDKVQYPNSSKWWIDNGDGTRGFYSVRACVTQVGYGYNSRIAQPCETGFYNQRDSYSPCKACPVGLTTSGPGAGATVADCGMKAGYGFYGAVTPCPVGTYNDVAYVASTTATCTTCPSGTTTSSTGADSVSGCNLCAAGFGDTNCATVCGGVGASATFGPPGRAVGTACASCTTSATGYSFDSGTSNDVFAPQPVSRTGATSSVDCLTTFAQFADGAWWLPTTSNTNMQVTTSVASFADCAATCTSAAKCQYITYDYNTQTCYMRWATNAIYAGTPWVGFKAVPSGDVGSAWSIHNSSNNSSITWARSAASGLYSWYQDPNWASVGVQSAAPNARNFTAVQQCLDACDDDPLCVGVVLMSAARPENTPKTCLLIHGDTTLGVFKRSMTRADPSRLTTPAL